MYEEKLMQNNKLSIDKFVEYRNKYGDEKSLAIINNLRSKGLIIGPSFEEIYNILIIFKSDIYKLKFLKIIKEINLMPSINNLFNFIKNIDDVNIKLETINLFHKNIFLSTYEDFLYAYYILTTVKSIDYYNKTLKLLLKNIKPVDYIINTLQIWENKYKLEGVKFLLYVLNNIDNNLNINDKIDLLSYFPNEKDKLDLIIFFIEKRLITNIEDFKILFSDTKFNINVEDKVNLCCSVSDDYEKLQLFSIFFDEFIPLNFNLIYKILITFKDDNYKLEYLKKMEKLNFPINNDCILNYLNSINDYNIKIKVLKLFSNKISFNTLQDCRNSYLILTNVTDYNYYNVAMKAILTNIDPIYYIINILKLSYNNFKNKLDILKFILNIFNNIDIYLSMDDIIKLLESFKIDGEKMQVLNICTSEETILNPRQFLKLINSFTNLDNKSKIYKRFIRTLNLSSFELEKILSIFDDVRDKKNIFFDQIKNDIVLDEIDLEHILDIFDDLTKKEIITELSYLDKYKDFDIIKNNNPKNNLKTNINNSIIDILSIPNDIERRKLLIKNLYCQNLTKNNIESIFNSVKNVKLFIMDSIKYTLTNDDIELDDLIPILKLARSAIIQKLISISDYYEICEIIKNNTSLRNNSNIYSLVLNILPILEDDKKICEFISDNINKTDEVLNYISLLNNDYQKKDIINILLNNNKIDNQSLLSLGSFFDNKKEYYIWLITEKNVINDSIILGLIDKITETDADIVYESLKNNVDKIRSYYIISFIDLLDKDKKREIITIWANNPNNYNELIYMRYHLFHKIMQLLDESEKIKICLKLFNENKDIEKKKLLSILNDKGKIEFFNELINSNITFNINLILSINDEISRSNLFIKILNIKNFDLTNFDFKYIFNSFFSDIAINMIVDAAKKIVENEFVEKYTCFLIELSNFLSEEKGNSLYTIISRKFPLNNLLALYNDEKMNTIIDKYIICNLKNIDFSNKNNQELTIIFERILSKINNIDIYKIFNYKVSIVNLINLELSPQNNKIIEDYLMNKFNDFSEEYLITLLNNNINDKLLIKFLLKKYNLDMEYSEEISSIIPFIIETDRLSFVKLYGKRKEYLNRVEIDINKMFQYFLDDYKEYIKLVENICKNNNDIEFKKVKEYLFRTAYLNTESGYIEFKRTLIIVKGFCKYKDFLHLLLKIPKEMITDNFKNGLIFILENQQKFNMEISDNLIGYDSIKLYNYLESKLNNVLEQYNSTILKIEDNLNEYSIEELKKHIFTLLFDSDYDKLKLTIHNFGGSIELEKMIFNNRKFNNNLFKYRAEYLIILTEVLETVINCNDIETLKDIFHNIINNQEKIKEFRLLYVDYEDQLRKLYELDIKLNISKNSLTNSKIINKRNIAIYDFSDSQYCLLAHVLSSNEKIENVINGISTTISNFICLSAISNRNQVYYHMNDIIFGFTDIPDGSFVKSSTSDIASNAQISIGSGNVLSTVIEQRGIIETSGAPKGINSEYLLYREGLKPSCIVLPGGREPTDEEIEIAKKYNLFFVKTQNIYTKIKNPKREIESKEEECNPTHDLSKSEQQQKLKQIKSKLLDIKQKKSRRKIAIMTDIHGLYEPALAVLYDIKKRGISEIYSLGDNIGTGPNPKEVIELLDKFNVKSVKGNHEIYALDGTENFKDHLRGAVKQEADLNSNWTKSKLSDEQLEEIQKYPMYYEVEIGGEKILLCHYINDYNTGKLVYDIDKYDHVFQGHIHFRNSNDNVDTLRGVGIGFTDDIQNAEYTILTEKEDGNGFDIEIVNVPIDINNLRDTLNESDLLQISREKITKWAKL